MPKSNGQVEEQEVSKTKVSPAILFAEFTESTTLHGIRNVFTEGSKIKRFIWTLCVLFAASIYLIFTKKLITSFLSYDVVTHVTLVNQDEATFPAVTICNFNPYRKEYLMETKLGELMVLFPNKTHIQWREEKFFALGNFTEISMEKFTRDAAHKINNYEMLYRCRFRNDPCDEQNFTQVFTRMGLCYTFNKGT